jgi:ABC-type transport system involved in multi-copper enzyme maturation permease subunit
MQVQDWLRLIIIIGSGLLLFGFFLVLSVFFSALTPHSSTSFLYMIVVWIFFVLIWPRSAVLLAGRAVDVPSVDEIAYKKAGFRSQVWQEDMQAMNNFKPSQTGDMQAMMTEFQQFMADQSDKRNEKTNAFNAKLNQERENRQKIQQQTAFMLSRFSPVTSFSLTAMQLAGTGIDLKNTFLENAKRYQELYAKFLKERIDGALPGGGLVLRMVNDDEEAKPIDPAEIPVFSFKSVKLSENIRNSAIDIGVLLVFNLLAFAASVFAFIRFDVR